MNRLEYAHHNRERYLDWCGQVFHSPYSDLDKLEWAIISAHCQFTKSVAAFQRTRKATDMEEYANELYGVGILAPYNRAAAVFNLRDMLEAGYALPYYEYRNYRRDYKLPGLGYCKLSFACSLIDPFGSDVVCLDTHIIAEYLGRQPTSVEVQRIYARLDRYEIMESMVLAEAANLDLPPFAYQWAVWDYRRARDRHVPPQPHDHLWRTPMKHQFPLFSNLVEVK